RSARARSGVSVRRMDGTTETLGAASVAISASGLFLLAGMALGGWKYLAIDRSPAARAPVYVDIAHRAALMYAFACVVLARLAELSPYSARVTLWATAVPIGFFAAAVVSYVVHGALRDTDNQLAH